MMHIDEKERKHMLDAFSDLRVADVRDGMDALGFHFQASVSPSIRPLWNTAAFGIARTCRYLPFRGPSPLKVLDEYWSWVVDYYHNTCNYPWLEEIEDGDFIVIDQSGVDAGLMGSCNSLDCFQRGARGLLTNGGVRDTGEIILQKIPFWAAMYSQSMVQCRLEFDAKDIAVSVGGVQIRPGDIIVADTDGVIAVPFDVAETVAQQARREHEKDKKDRKRFYDQLGWDADTSVTPL